MSHPHFHALSSERLFKYSYGRVLPYHNFYDQTKKAYPKIFHRAFLHNTYGIELSKLVFSDESSEVLEKVGLQHLQEDCSCIPSLFDWFEDFDTSVLVDPRIVTDRSKYDTSRVSRMLFKKFGNTQSDYDDLVNLMLPPVLIENSDYTFLVLNNSVGIFIVESIFGTLYNIKSNGKTIPTRILAEYCVRAVNRDTIPTLEELSKGLKLDKKWQKFGAIDLSGTFQ